ncbi:hypothetical protein [Flavobacterium gawalongense]|uniref:hypothetical protein n=1 Tax=Flavobacterium gawalongense TaxID=2594432 RepID=UPI001C3FDABD|nr:hypothetical protein [Flavobacterium gawalongense]
MLNLPVKIENVKIVENGSKYFVNLTLQQIESPDALKGMVMLVFSDVPESEESDENTLKQKNKVFPENKKN